MKALNKYVIEIVYPKESDTENDIIAIVGYTLQNALSNSNIDCYESIILHTATPLTRFQQSVLSR